MTIQTTYHSNVSAIQASPRGGGFINTYMVDDMNVATKQLAKQALNLINAYTDKDENAERRLAIIHAANSGTIYAPLVQKWCDEKKQNWKKRV